MIDIPPFLTYVRSEYLYSLEEGFGYFTPATVFAISSSPNETLRLQLVTDDSKILFNSIPVSALANSKTAPRFDEGECVFAACPDDNAIVVQYDYLSRVESCGVWKKDGTFWQKGIYLFTIEWPKAKQQLHFLELEDSNYALWSNERLTWGEEVPEKIAEY